MKKEMKSNIKYQLKKIQLEANYPKYSSQGKKLTRMIRKYYKALIVGTSRLNI